MKRKEIGFKEVRFDGRGRGKERLRSCMVEEEERKTFGIRLKE